MRRPVPPVCPTFQGMHSNNFTFYYLYEVNIIQNNYSEKIMSDMSQKKFTVSMKVAVPYIYMCASCDHKASSILCSLLKAFTCYCMLTSSKQPEENT